MLKRYISLFLATVMLFTAFVGCKKDSDDKTSDISNTSSSVDSQFEITSSETDSGSNDGTVSENTSSEVNVDSEFDDSSNTEDSNSEDTFDNPDAEEQDEISTEDSNSEDTFDNPDAEEQDEISTEAESQVTVPGNSTKPEENNNPQNENLSNLGNEGDSDSKEENSLYIGAYVNDPKYKDSKKINFFEDEEFMYNIVYPADMVDSTAKKVRTALFGMARRINDKRPNYITDEKDYDNGKKSIFAGLTKHPISSEAKLIIDGIKGSYKNYVIMVKNGNIAIYSDTEAGLEDALNFFIEEIFYDIDSYIPEDYYFLYKSVSTPNSNDVALSINKLPINSFAIVSEEYPGGMTYRGCEELKTVIKEFSGYDIPYICGDKHNFQNLIKVVRTGDNRDTYNICFDGNNLVITGGSDYALNAALHFLAKNISQVKKGDRINIPSTYNHSDKYTENTYGSNGYKLVWSEEFDTSLNSDYYFIENYFDTNYNRAFSPDNAIVKDGNLEVTNSWTTGPDGTRCGSGYSFRNYSMEFNYGYFEIRQKIPHNKGSWHALWALTPERYKVSSGSGEIDVSETFGTNWEPTAQLHTWWLAGRKIKGLFATDEQLRAGHIAHLDRGDPTVIDAFSGGNQYHKLGKTSLGEDFHTYGCEWTPAYMKFYLDGACMVTVDLKTKLVHAEHGYRIAEYFAFTNGTPMNLIFSTTFGAKAGFIEQPDENDTFAKHYVDYIRLYQMDGIGYINQIKEKK